MPVSIFRSGGGSVSEQASCGLRSCHHDQMYESTFELVDRFAAALPRSEELAQPGNRSSSS